MTALEYIALGFSGIIVSLGLSIVIHPNLLKNGLKVFLEKKYRWPIALVRLLLGALFISIAGDTGNPLLLYLFGGILLVSGVSVPFLPSDKLDQMANWWTAQKDYIIRIWGFIALLFGIFLCLSISMH